MAVILKAEGSTPGKFGWKAVVERDGQIWGTVGGGAAEAGVQRRAVEAIAAGRSEVFDFAFDGGTLQDGIPICGGAMRILIAPIDRSPWAMGPTILQCGRRRLAHQIPLVV